MPLTRRIVLATPFLISAGRADPDGGADALKGLTEGGCVALISHGHSPGEGELPGSRLGACETQRNLDERGREQAVDLGRRLREAGVLVTQVRASRWCRTLETASLAFPDIPVTPEASLDPIDGDNRAAIRRVGNLISRWSGRQGVLALVSHPRLIAAVTDRSMSAAQVIAVVPRTAGFGVVGRWY